ncbi:hypothetical protein [Limosilactobacillus reuteri]|uniref:hypothetical protein n=1 Tax=Limosilactobacillus reuteri TaxID=1598 RepID=UPI00214D5D79|nr:hypothetical protein [Limosilactobacillus reuteri]UUW67878.1 hypothetical protein NUJ10_07600 [Limosilactobacillus reuteri]
MASEAYDYEPFDNTDHTMKQIADAIRHKGYGKDVREAIAQGMESYDRTSGELFKRMNKVEEKIDQEIEDRKKGDGNLQGQINNLQERCQKLEDQVKQLQKDNNDHEERLKKIERLLFDSETITVTDPTDDIRASQSATEISDTANDDGSISTVVIS